MSLCPHGYTAFWDCPTCEEPMGTAPTERHEFGCTAYVGRPCICPQLRQARAAATAAFLEAIPEGVTVALFTAEGASPLHSAHRIPVPGCDRCQDLLAEARGLMDEGWAE